MTGPFGYVTLVFQNIVSFSIYYRPSRFVSLSFINSLDGGPLKTPLPKSSYQTVRPVIPYLFRLTDPVPILLFPSFESIRRLSQGPNPRSVLVHSVKEPYQMTRFTVVEHVVLIPRLFMEFVVSIQNVITTIDILVNPFNI